LDPPELDPREPELDGRGAGRLTGGADPPPRLWLLTGGGPAGEGADGRADEGAGGADAARGRGPVPADTLPAERPAPRDQPEAGADAGPPDPFGPPAPVAPCRGGRSSGGATRLLPPSASVTFLVRAEPGPEPPPTTRREPPLASPSPSAGGGASGRSRDAYASPVPAAAGSAADPAASAAAPRPAAVPAAVPAATPAAAPTATAAACPWFRRAHRAAR
jgi:hypothetical protein